MNWSNVKLILAREIRDQLRDRRTLFMIAVLPILLYPLLGMSLFQVMQFLREHSARVLVIGAPEGAELPALVDEGRLPRDLFGKDEAKTVNLLHVSTQSAAEATNAGPDDRLEHARHDMQADGYDVVVYFPPEFGERLAEFREAIGSGSEPAKSATHRPLRGCPTWRSIRICRGKRRGRRITGFRAS